MTLCNNPDPSQCVIRYITGTRLEDRYPAHPYIFFHHNGNGIVAICEKFGVARWGSGGVAAYLVRPRP